MKTFVVRYVEEVEYECKVKAKTEDEAREIVNDGSTPNETIVDATHFQITEVYEESNE